MDRMVVLVVDDDAAIRENLAELLTQAGYLVRTAETGEQALAMLQTGSFDVALLDVLLPDVSGLEVLKSFRSGGGEVPVIVLSGLTAAEDAVRAMKLGASDYLTKPFGREELEDALARALGRTREVPAGAGLVAGGAPAQAERVHGASRTVDTSALDLSKNVVRRNAPAETTLLEPEPRIDDRQLIWVSPAMRRSCALIERIADTDVPVLLLGESGTGKEVVAREIHRRSRRHARPFIKVNCAALPAELLESELFGHEKGAFTGATAEKPGKFELADQGSIFLDEIGEMAIRLQAKLLQVLQDEEFFRVGGKRSVRVDSRVVVATNRELEKEIELGNFREDLYYRLNVVAVRLPPLRERREDIVPLVEHFLRKYGQRYQNVLAEVPAEVLRAFQEYEWPGNVRELENLVRRLVVLKDPGPVLDELRHGRTVASSGTAVINEVQPQRVLTSPFSMAQPPPPPMNIPEDELSLKDIGKRAAMLAEREAILAMLHRTAWNKRKAANKLRISYKALLYKIKESGIIDPRASAEF